jgi:hypothetical protein
VRFDLGPHRSQRERIERHPDRMIGALPKGNAFRGR